MIKSFPECNNWSHWTFHRCKCSGNKTLLWNSGTSFRNSDRILQKNVLEWSEREFRMAQHSRMHRGPMYRDQRYQITRKNRPINFHRANFFVCSANFFVCSSKLFEQTFQKFAQTKKVCYVWLCAPIAISTGPSRFQLTRNLIFDHLS